MPVSFLIKLQASGLLLYEKRYSGTGWYSFLTQHLQWLLLRVNYFLREILECITCIEFVLIDRHWRFQVHFFFCYPWRNAYYRYYNLGQNICRNFHFLAHFPFTISEAELDYYHQKVNVPFASLVAEQLMT